MAGSAVQRACGAGSGLRRDATTQCAGRNPGGPRSRRGPHAYIYQCGRTGAGRATTSTVSGLIVGLREKPCGRPWLCEVVFSDEES